jgi:hypothetical protein
VNELQQHRNHNDQNANALYIHSTCFSRGLGWATSRQNVPKLAAQRCKYRLCIGLAGKCDSAQTYGEAA